MLETGRKAYSDVLHALYTNMGEGAPITAIYICPVHGYAGERRSLEGFPDYTSLIVACMMSDPPVECKRRMVTLDEILGTFVGS